MLWDLCVFSVTPCSSPGTTPYPSGLAIGENPSDSGSTKEFTIRGNWKIFMVAISVVVAKDWRQVLFRRSVCFVIITVQTSASKFVRRPWTDTSSMNDAAENASRGHFDQRDPYHVHLKKKYYTPLKKEKYHGTPKIDLSLHIMALTVCNSFRIRLYPIFEFLYWLGMIRYVSQTIASP